MSWLEALILGAVQGLTEFLPISSDGHLNLAQQLFAAVRGSGRGGDANLFIIVILHVGTLMAILLHYRSTIAAGIRSVLSPSKLVPGAEVDEPATHLVVPTSYRRSTVLRVLTLGVIATLPVVPVGLFLKKQLESTFEGTGWTGAGFLVTAAVLMLTTRMKGGAKGPNETTWTDALLVGVAQAFAPLPGVSRSGLTIAAALALGFSRRWAVGFSLLMAVIGVSGATVLELKDPLPKLTSEEMAQILAGTVVSFLVGYLAIVWLVRVVQSGRMWYFSVYLVILGAIVLGWSATQGRSPHVSRSAALDRPLRGVGTRPRPEGGPGGNVDRPLVPGARAGLARPRPSRCDWPDAPGLVLG